MEWWQYYSIISLVLFFVLVLLGMSLGLLAVFVRSTAALGEIGRQEESAAQTEPGRPHAEHAAGQAPGDSDSQSRDASATGD